VIYDVNIVAVPEQAVVCLRSRGPLSEMGARLRHLRELVEQAGLTAAGPMMARFYDSDAARPDLDYDVCLPVWPEEDDFIPDAVGEAHGQWIPLHHALQAVHSGPHDAMQDAWRAVDEARAALGYTASGPFTEVYVTGHESAADPADHLTEVRLPYAR
jgi:effector-binding domain-containing protein